MKTRNILGAKLLPGVPTCKREEPDSNRPGLRLFCDTPMKLAADDKGNGYDPWMVKFRCPTCGQEEWIHRYVLPLTQGGDRDPDD